MSEVRLDVDDQVATITLCRPDALNAQTPQTWAALTEIGRGLTGEVRVVVVRGEGRAFSSGLDRAVFTGFADMARLPAEECDALIASYQGAFAWLRRPDIVSVAAVQGHAIGAGFQLALACDLRLAAEDAQFCMAETTLGLVPDLGGTKPLVTAVGQARALEICLTGRRVGAAEAARLGIVTAVVPREELEQATSDLVAALLAPPRQAVTETKALLYGAAARTASEQEAAERQAQARRLRDLVGAGE